MFLIISLLFFVFAGCNNKNEYFIINTEKEQDCDKKNVIFNIDGYQYSLSIDLNNSEDFQKYVLIIKNESNEQTREIYMSTTFFGNEIYSENLKNGIGYSMKYNTQNKEKLIYTIPLSEEQLNTVIEEDGRVLILPPEF